MSSVYIILCLSDSFEHPTLFPRLTWGTGEVPEHKVRSLTFQRLLRRFASWVDFLVCFLFICFVYFYFLTEGLKAWSLSET